APQLVHLHADLELVDRHVRADEKARVAVEEAATPEVGVEEAPQRLAGDAQEQILQPAAAFQRPAAQARLQPFGAAVALEQAVLRLPGAVTVVPFDEVMQAAVI